MKELETKRKKWRKTKKDKSKTKRIRVQGRTKDTKIQEW